MFFEKILNFFKEFQAPGYTLAETIFYSIILVTSLYLVFKIAEKLRISFDERLAVALAPYIALGSLLRVSRDLGFLPFIIFKTPLIYFFIFFFIAISLAISFLLQIKFKILFYKPFFLFGILTLTFPLALLTFVQMVNLEGIILVSLLFLPWLIIFKFIKWKVENKAITLIQLFDGTVTSTAIGFFGYGEQHWLPTIIISLFNPFLFIFVKLSVVVIILILLDKFCEKKELRNYIKLIIGILGAATGIRDFTCLSTFCIPH